MKLSNGMVTFELSLESLAYILVNEVDRGEFLGLLTKMADIGADSNFEWEVIEHLFGYLKKCDSESAFELLSALRETAITVEVEGGVVMGVAGLPAGWVYELLDHDVEKETAGSDSESVYWVDIPGWCDGDWRNAGTFFSRKEAIEFVKNTYGGDDEGRVSLITEGTRVEEE